MGRVLLSTFDIGVLLCGTLDPSSPLNDHRLLRNATDRPSGMPGRDVIYMRVATRARLEEFPIEVEIEMMRLHEPHEGVACLASALERVARDRDLPF